MKYLQLSENRSGTGRRAYEIKNTDGDVNTSMPPAMLTGMIVIPDEREPKEYLEEMFPGCVERQADWLFYVWDHPIINWAGDLPQLMLHVQAHGAVFMCQDGMNDLHDELDETGHSIKGNQSTANGLLVYYNGLVAQYVHRWGRWKLTIDPKRASQVIKRRLKGPATKAKKQITRIMQCDLNKYGTWMMVWLWHKLHTRELLRATMSRCGYQNFQSSSRLDALQSIEAMHSVCKANKLRRKPTDVCKDDAWRGASKLDADWCKEMLTKIKVLLPKLKAKLKTMDEHHKDYTQVSTEVKVLGQLNNMLKGKGHA